MIKNVKVENGFEVYGFEVHVRYELEPYEVQVLKELKEKKYLEYKMHLPIDSFDMDYYYEGSNTDIHISKLSDLERNGFIKPNLDAWHTEFNLTEFGKKIAEELV